MLIQGERTRKCCKNELIRFFGKIINFSFARRSVFARGDLAWLCTARRPVAARGGQSTELDDIDNRARAAAGDPAADLGAQREGWRKTPRVCLLD